MRGEDRGLCGEVAITKNAKPDKDVGLYVFDRAGLFQALHGLCEVNAKVISKTRFLYNGKRTGV